MKEELKEFAAALKQRMEKLGLDEIDMEVTYKIPPSTLTRVLAGDRDAHVTTYLKVGKALGLRLRFYVDSDE